MKLRMLFRCWTVLLGLSVALYAWLARYAHPVADDFCYAAKARGMGLWDWSVGEWMGWNGRYASNLLMVHGPLTWFPDLLAGYRIVPIALLLFTFLSAWFLLRRATRHALPIHGELMVALVFLALYLNLMPDLGEGFYWFTGAITYQLGSILMMVHLALLIPDGTAGIAFPKLALNLLLALAITGMDEIHMLLMVCLHIGHAAWRIRSGKGVAGALALLAAVLAGAALMALAPGNAVRAGMFAGTHRFWWSLGMSAMQALRFVGIWALSPALLATCLLYIPLHGRLLRLVPAYSRILRLPVWIALALPFLLVMATTFPAYWSTGLLGQHRTINVACLFFIPVALLNVGIALERGPLRKWATTEQGPRQWAFGLALALLAFNVTGNGYALHADLWGGRVAEYDRVLLGRENHMRAAAADPEARITLPPLSRPPRTLASYEELGPLRDWMLHCEARWFGAQENQATMQQPVILGRETH